MDADHSRSLLPRRALLAAVAVPALSGCSEFGLDASGECTYGFTEEFETEAVELFSVGVATANQEEGGTCGRTSSTVCMHTSLDLDRSVVARIEGRTPDGGVVVDHAAEDGEIFRLQVAELDPPERVEREIVLFDADGEVVDRAGAYARCE